MDGGTLGREETVVPEHNRSTLSEKVSLGIEVVSCFLREEEIRGGERQK